MPLRFLDRIDSYVYQNRASCEDTLRYKLLQGPTPGRSGSYGGGSLLEARNINAKGRLFANNGDPETLRTQLDAFRAAHGPSELPHRIYLQDDRFVNGYVESIGEIEWKKPITFLDWTVSFICTDPYIYSNQEFEYEATTGTFSITVGGTWQARPILTYNVTTAPAGARHEWTNITTGQTFVYYPPAVDEFVIDMNEEKVTRTSNGADATSGVDGEFLVLAPGVNDLQVVSFAGPGVGGTSDIDFVADPPKFLWRDTWI